MSIEPLTPKQREEVHHLMTKGEKQDWTVEWIAEKIGVLPAQIVLTLNERDTKLLVLAERLKPINATRYNNPGSVRYNHRLK